jgi:UDP-glucose 4-epimerase
VLEVMHEIETSMGRPIRLIFSDRRPGDPAILVADPSLARRELGWSPQYPHLRTQIEHAITSMKKHSIIS